MTETPAQAPWMDPYPAPPGAAAYHGVLGEIVERLAPQTEADAMGILGSAIVACGNVLGRSVYADVGKRHHTVFYALLVGPTASRKGTAQAVADAVLEVAAPAWRTRRRVSGMASGEGLIAAVRDEQVGKEPIRDKGKQIVGYQEIITDPGVADKRLCVVEEEFGRTLRVLNRENNTLSAVMRDAWDGNPLNTLTKAATHCAAPHISIAGHITPGELRDLLRSVDIANGLANRFLFFAVRRARYLPRGGALDQGAVHYLGAQLDSIATEWGERAAHERGPVRLARDPETEALWARVYPALVGEREGLFGAVTSRAEAQVLRLSLLYAALDVAPAIRPDHLRAALAVWRYCEETVSCLFGASTGDPVMETILAALNERPRTQTELANLFSRHIPAAQLEETLLLLEDAGLVRQEAIATGGRPKTLWRLTTPEERGEGRR